MKAIYGVRFGIRIFDITVPAHPVEIGYIDVRPEKSESVTGSSITGDTVTVLHGYEWAYLWHYGLVRYDVSDPLNPIELSRLEPDEIPGYGGNSIEVERGRAYVSRGTIGPKIGISSGGFDIYDIRKPHEISILGQHSWDTYIYGIEVLENYAYLTGIKQDIFPPYRTEKTIIMNMQDSQDLKQVGFILDGSGPMGQNDGLLFLVEDGLHILRYAVSRSLNLDYGGVLVFDDPAGMRTTVHAPQVAMIEPLDLYYAPVPGYVSPPGNAQVGDVFELTAYQEGERQFGFPFAMPVNLTISYTDELLGLVTDESRLTLHRWNGVRWEDAAGTCSPASRYTRDLENNTLSLPLCQLGRYGLFGPTETIYLPIVEK